MNDCRKAFFPVFAGFGLVCALAVAAVAVWWGALNQDEGWYLYAAKMTREGFLPYRDYFFTQGPALPFVYGAFAPLWAKAGILGGRVFTCIIGILSVFAAAFLAQVVAKEHRKAAFWTAFALLGCNIYHVYFTTIPKTYALGTLFLTSGFLAFAFAEKRRLASAWAVSGLLMALASGTRISLVLAPFVCGCALLATFRRRRFAFLWFGLGAAAGAFLTYGIFTLDPESLEGLLAAQKYHAGRGGFDLAFTIGSVSRLTRGYLAVVAVAILTGFAGFRQDGRDSVKTFLPLAILVSCGAVMLLQLSAPFPYDDYQVPVVPPLAAVVSAWAAGRFGAKAAPLALAATLAASFSSPLLQEWATCGQDRFWSVKREKSALAQLRETARRINELDPGGTDILTQDLYLAVETGRKVPRGFEMGPFSYFPGLDAASAMRRHVLDKRILSNILAEAEAPVAAGSGYAFAIEAPTCAEVPFRDQMEFWETLKLHYEKAFSIGAFGQNNTPLVVLKRRKETAGNGNP